MAAPIETPTEMPTPHRGIVRCGKHFCIEIVIKSKALQIYVLDKHEANLKIETIRVLKISYQTSPTTKATDLHLKRESQCFSMRLPVDQSSFLRSLLRVTVKTSNVSEIFKFIVDGLGSPHTISQGVE